MLNLFDRFDTASLDFLRSQIMAGIKIPAVSINDDGYLPAEVDSPIKYFCELGGKHEPLYFDKLSIPPYWKINASATGGTVNDLDQKRANLIFSSNDNSRSIKVVQWLTKDGKVSWSDHYDRHGQLFAKTYFENGRPALRKYFNKEGQVVITWNFGDDDIFLNSKGHFRHFANHIDFVVYFLQLRQYDLDHVFYNTLGDSLSVTLKLPHNGTDTLFWHEKTGNDLPGNMKVLMQNETRTKHIIFQRYMDWQQYNGVLMLQQQHVDFNYLGTIYPHPRPNQLRPRALILTNSDQIEQLDQLTKLLPNVHFDIAALTTMSAKLLAYGGRANVDVYPSASTKLMKKMLANDDLYLDINHANEIVDAVRAAFEQNMLIVAFKDTCHRPDLVDAPNIFEPGQGEKMADLIKDALSSADKMKQLIDTQRLHASDMLVDDYKKGMEALIHGGKE